MAIAISNSSLLKEKEEKGEEYLHKREGGSLNYIPFAAVAVVVGNCHTQDSHHTCWDPEQQGQEHIRNSRTPEHIRNTRCCHRHSIGFPLADSEN